MLAAGIQVPAIKRETVIIGTSGLFAATAQRESEQNQTQHMDETRRSAPMAEFEGEKRLNRETSELEVRGKYKLSEEELDNVAGGCGDDDNTYNGHPKVAATWKPLCGTTGRDSCGGKASCCACLCPLPPEECKDNVIYYCSWL